MKESLDNAPAVCLMGASLGTGNRGVSALSASLIGLVLRLVPGAELSLLIGNRSNKPFKLNLGDEEIEVRVANYRRSPFAPLHQQLWCIFFLSVLYYFFPVTRNFICRKNFWIRNVAAARIVGDIRGGDSFSDIYGLSRFVSGSIPVIAALLVNPNFILFPQTYGPFRSRIARWIAAFIVRRARHVISRDQDSIPLAASMTRRPIMFSPDVAFTLQAIPPQEIGIVPPLHLPKGTPLMGVNVNGLMFNGGYNRKNMFSLKLNYSQFLISFLNHILSRSDAHVLFVPHTFAPPASVESDPAACVSIIEALEPRYRDRIHLVTLPHNQNEIKWVIGKCDFFIGSRMHACIAALSQGIPALGVAYSKKFKGVFESVGAADWVLDGRVLSAEEAVTAAISFFENRTEMGVKLARTIPEAQSLVYKVFEEVLASAQPVISAGNPIVSQDALSSPKPGPVTCCD